MIDWKKPLFDVDGNALILIDGWPQPDCDGDYRVGRRDGGDMKANKGSTLFYSVVTSEGIAWSDTMRVVADNADDPTDELADLRAFMETALASGYVPPEPVDSDLLAAREICFNQAVDEGCDEVDMRRHYNKGTAQNNGSVKLALAAIAWARANPR